MDKFKNIPDISTLILDPHFLQDIDQIGSLKIPRPSEPFKRSSLVQKLHIP